MDRGRSSWEQGSVRTFGDAEMSGRAAEPGVQGTAMSRGGLGVVEHGRRSWLRGLSSSWEEAGGRARERSPGFRV
jgi:hypothetical protein